jgi:hypothetical protein
LSTLYDRVWALDRALAKYPHGQPAALLNRRLVMREAFTKAMAEAREEGYTDGMRDARDDARADRELETETEDSDAQD